MQLQKNGARPEAGTGILSGGTIRRSRAPGAASERPIFPWAFYALTFASGGPLALAAQGAPGVLAGASGSTGLATGISLGAFGAAIWIWLRYSGEVQSSGGLFAFVEAAAGRRVALVQAVIWLFSYVLYVVYTTVQIVYDLLPVAVPGERSYQTLLALLIPVAIAGVMIAGRAAVLVVMGLLAGGQLVLAGALDGVTLAHVSTPVSTFGTSGAGGALAKASVQSSLLYVCGSLPLFLGSELARPARTIRRGLSGGFLLTGLVTLLAVAPLAASPGLLHTAIPGVTVAQEFSGRAFGEAIGIGVAASTAGLIILEYLAITRLLPAIGPWRSRGVTLALGALLVVAAPISLIDPDGFYTTLLRPSLAALWLSQLIVFAVYPLFVAKRGRPILGAWALSVVASGLAVYGLVTALQTSST